MRMLIAMMMNFVPFAIRSIKRAKVSLLLVVATIIFSILSA